MRRVNRKRMVMIHGHKVWNTVENIVHRVLALLFKMAGKELSDDVFKVFMQFVKFGIVGVSNMVLAYGTYMVCLIFFQKMDILRRTDYFTAHVTAFIVSTLWSFYWNNKSVFVLQKGEKRSVWKAMAKTFLSYSFTGLFLNSVLLVLWVEVIHISEFIAPVINSIIDVPLNFIINKFWTFKSEKKV